MLKKAFKYASIHLPASQIQSFEVFLRDLSLHFTKYGGISLTDRLVFKEIQEAVGLIVDPITYQVPAGDLGILQNADMNMLKWWNNFRKSNQAGMMHELLVFADENRYKTL